MAIGENVWEVEADGTGPISRCRVIPARLPMIRNDDVRHLARWDGKTRNVVIISDFPMPHHAVGQLVALLTKPPSVRRLGR